MPTTPAANGVSSKLAGTNGFDDADRREKRMKRFVNGAGQGMANGAANTASLSERLSFGRVAQAGKSGYGGGNMYGSSEVEAVYDPVSVSRSGRVTSAALTRETDPAQNVIDWDKHTIVGTNPKLEKPYLRLTEVSRPAASRLRRV